MHATRCGSITARLSSSLWNDLSAFGAHLHTECRMAHQTLFVLRLRQIVAAILRYDCDEEILSTGAIEYQFRLTRSVIRSCEYQLVFTLVVEIANRKSFLGLVFNS